MKKVTSATVWSDASGLRLSVTYSKIDTETREIISDNTRENFILMNDSEITTGQNLINLSQEIVNSKE